MCDDTAGVHTRKSIQFDDTYIEVRRMLVMLEFNTKQNVFFMNLHTLWWVAVQQFLFVRRSFCWLCILSVRFDTNKFQNASFHIDNMETHILCFENQHKPKLK